MRRGKKGWRKLPHVSGDRDEVGESDQVPVRIHFEEGAPTPVYGSLWQPSVEGRPGACGQDVQGARRRRGVDDKREGGESTRHGRRGGPVETPESRSRQRGFGRRGGGEAKEEVAVPKEEKERQEREKRKRGQETQKPEEVEGQSKETPGGSVRHDGAGPRPRHSVPFPKERQKDRQEEEKEGERYDLEHQPGRRRKLLEYGRRRDGMGGSWVVRGEDAAQEDSESSARGADSGLAEGGPRVPDYLHGTSVDESGTRSTAFSSAVLPQPDGEPTKRTDAEGIPHTGVCPGLVCPGAYLRDGGPHHAEVEVAEQHPQRHPLLCEPNDGAPTSGQDAASELGRNTGSGTGLEERREGYEECWKTRRRMECSSTPMGAKRQRQAREGRRKERQRERRQRQRGEQRRRREQEMKERGGSTEKGDVAPMVTGVKKGSEASATAALDMIGFDYEVPTLLGGADEVGGVQNSCGGSEQLRLGIKKLLRALPNDPFPLADLGKLLMQCMFLCCKPSSMVGVDAFSSLVDTSTCTDQLSPELERWRSAILLALGHLSGREISETSGFLRDSAMKKSIGAQLKRFDIWSEQCSMENFGKFFSSKSIGYSGDEVKLAQQLVWQAVSDSLPQGVGELKLEDFCTLGTKDFVMNFERYLIPEKDQVRMKPPRVVIGDEDWPDLAKGLLDRKICKILPLKHVYHAESLPLLNGLFAVGKGEFVQNLETQRLIMNLTPVNSLMRELRGDVSTLPSLQNFGQMFLDDDEQCLVSSEDVRCFFYLFRTPDCWHRYMAFNKILPVDMVPDEYKGEDCVLCATVLPMGFQASVGIAQHVHRNVVKVALSRMSPAGGAEGEIRKDLSFPQKNDRYRIYLDNFDQLEVVHKDLADVLRGSSSTLVEELQKTHEEFKIPRHPKKAVSRQLRAEVQGSLVLGDVGIAIAKPQKIVQYLGMVLQLLQKGETNLKELQVTCGGLVYLTTFRRPLLCGLNRVWEFMQELGKFPPVIRLPLPDGVVAELVRFACLTPLAQISFRTPVAGVVTCSDASMSGGGICRSVGLSDYGNTAALAEVRGDIHEPHDHVQVLSVGLFDGISGLRTACEALRLPMAGHISIEIDAKGRRVVESFYPDTIFVEDIKLLTEDMVTEFALKFSNAGLVLIGAGPPCQGVSKLNFDRRGALRDHRSSLFQEVPKVVDMFKRKFIWTQVQLLMESVASMGDEDRTVMSQGVQLQPYKIDSLGLTLCRRPRLYWVTWELVEDEGVEISLPQTDDWDQYGEVQFAWVADSQALLEPGWRLAGDSLPTFTTARPSPVPGRKPAGLYQCNQAELQYWKEDEHKFPPYQYQFQSGLVNSKGLWRTPSVAEREALMGFPVGYTKMCVPKGEQKGKEYENHRLTLLGNSWQVGVIAWLLAQLCHRLGLTPFVKVKDIVNRLTPGKGDRLQGVLLRPPLGRQRARLQGNLESQLSRKLMGIASVKGDDLLLQGESEHQVRHHRLRASVPGALWKWRDVAGWTWKHSGDHINVLEMRAVHTTVRWWVQKKKVQSIKFLHLVDSLVCLHSLSRGRSSSKKLRRTVMRINSLLLGSDLHPIYGYIHTSQNPADRPSRRGNFVKKKWLK